MSATIYPAVMAAVSGAVILFIMTSVIPRLAEALLSVKATLSTTIVVMLAISNFVTSWYGVLIIIVVIGLIVYGFIAWKKSPKGREKWDAIRLKMPIFGNITRMVAVARFTRTLSTLLSSGVPLLKSLDIVRNVVANNSLEKAIDDVRDAVREGEDIATPLKKSGQFPPMVTHMIAVGEKTGELEGMLNRVASNYEQRVSTQVERLTALLQPVLIIAMGGVAFLIVSTIFSAMSGLNKIR